MYRYRVGRLQQLLRAHLVLDGHFARVPEELHDGYEEGRHAAVDEDEEDAADVVQTELVVVRRTLGHALHLERRGSRRDCYTGTGGSSTREEPKPRLSGTTHALTTRET